MKQKERCLPSGGAGAARAGVRGERTPGRRTSEASEGVGEDEEGFGVGLLGVWEAEADGNASSSRGEERLWWWVECVIVGRLGGFGEKGFLHEHSLSLRNLLCRW